MGATAILGALGGYGTAVGDQQAAAAQRAFQQQQLEEQANYRTQIAQDAADARRQTASDAAAGRTQNALTAAASKWYDDSKASGIIWTPGTYEKIRAAQNPAQTGTTDPGALAVQSAMPQLVMSKAVQALTTAAQTGNPTPIDGGLGFVNPPPSKAAPAPKNIDPLSPEGIMADAKRAGQVKAAEVAATPKEPKPIPAAQQATMDQLGGLLGPMTSAHETLKNTETPGIVQRTLSHVPGQPLVNDNTQLQQTAGQTWTTNYMQSLKTRGMPLPTLDYMNKTYVNQPGDNPAVKAMKEANRLAAMQGIAKRAGVALPTGGTDPFADMGKKPDDE